MYALTDDQLSIYLGDVKERHWTSCIIHEKNWRLCRNVSRVQSIRRFLLPSARHCFINKHCKYAQFYALYTAQSLKHLTTEQVLRNPKAYSVLVASSCTSDYMRWFSFAFLIYENTVWIILVMRVICFISCHRIKNIFVTIFFHHVFPSQDTKLERSQTLPANNFLSECESLCWDILGHPAWSGVYGTFIKGLNNSSFS